VIEHHGKYVCIERRGEARRGEAMAIANANANAIELMN